MGEAVEVVVPAARLVFPAEDRAEILRMIDGSLASGSLTLGPHTARLEEAFGASHGAAHAVATSSGTSSLEIILRALDVEGGEVIVPANTFYATAGAVIHAGGRPRFADVAADTFALTVDSVTAALTPATVGVVMVHIGGSISPEVVAIRELCDRRGIFLVEDAAHAHGSSLDGRSAGSFGVAAAFSFYPTKVITSGEGGMILTGDEQLAADARVYRDQGKAGFFGGEHVRLGYAWRLSELHAAVGIVQERRLAEFVARRRQVAAMYDEALSDCDAARPLPVPTGCESNYYKYPVLLDPALDRAIVKQELRDAFGVVLSGEVYARPLHREPVLAPFADGPLPVAEDVCARHVCLPIHSDMTDDEAELVVAAVRKVTGS